ncbi:FAD/FMN-containing dehydrogenase [Promicromonospora thailandica]|uniref:FAD/FMN-containing dehydrogenase n=2 Tax=Promicromonospora thailandica TaxID=765201 RepID=A0A9X2G2Q8_9MICO|nr:FAD-binding oxidoreductase [Promicromonospora thailandica]MCP2264403.1 FAD/FMN-containing dehydrogenase [Promicromonospora thailandica]BFF20902.1 FAD-binding oxidoreductase [Promicromonospora thailandica]
MSSYDLDTTTLRARLTGALVLPGDADWDGARQAWQLTVDQRPEAVVLAENADDVVAAVDAARAAGLRVAAQATGHNANPLGSLSGTVLVKTSRMRGVAVDPEKRTVRVEAGALWGDVTAAAAPYGLMGLAGSAADVGVVGYTLGGGLSWLARKHGLAANGVVAAEAVTADGVLRRIDASTEPDLFWAVRGGGGSFAVVTALELDLVPVGDLHGGTLFWPVERAAEVLHAWREWTATLPDEVTSIGRLLRFPPLEEIPEPVRGQSFVAVELVSLLDQDRTDAVLAPLRELAPVMDTVHPCTPHDLAQIHMDPPQPVPAAGDGVLLGALPAEALDAYLALTGPDTDFSLLSTEIRHLGGALAPQPGTGGAVSGLDAAYAVFTVTITPDEAAVKATHQVLDAVAQALRPWSTGTSYLNFAERSGGAPFAEPAVLARLGRVKAQYDPADVVRGNHPVAPAA